MSETRSPLRRLARSAGTLTVLNLTSMGLTFIIGVMLARLLGASGYGLYGLGMTIATLVGLVTEFGLPVLVMREFAASDATGKWSSTRGLDLWTVRFILLGSAGVMLVFAALYLSGVLDRQSEFVGALLWAIALIPAAAICKIRGWALLSLGQTLAGQLPVLLIRPGLFALGLVLVWAIGVKVGAPGAMALQVVAAYIALTVVGFSWRRLRPAALVLATPTYDWRKWLTVCIPMGLTEGLRLLQGQGAVLLLGALATPRDVGVFRVADQVSAVTGIGLSILNVAATPLLAALHAKQDREGQQRVLGAVTVATVISTLMLGLPFALAGTWVFAMVFGKEFGASHLPYVLIWASWTIVAAAGPVQTYANMTGRERLTFLNFGLSTLLIAVIGLVAIPRFGVTGAALAILIANPIAAFWLWHRILRDDRLNASLFLATALAMLAPRNWTTYARMLHKRPTDRGVDGISS